MVEFLGPMHWFTLIKGSDSGGEAKQTEDFPRQAVCVLPCWCLVWPTEEHTSAAIYPQSSVKKGFGVFFGRKGRKNHDIVLSSDNIQVQNINKVNVADFKWSSKRNTRYLFGTCSFYQLVCPSRSFCRFYL